MVFLWLNYQMVFSSPHRFIRLLPRRRRRAEFGASHCSSQALTLRMSPGEKGRWVLWVQCKSGVARRIWYIYIYTYVYTYMYIHTCIYIYIYIWYVYMICILFCIRIGLNVCILELCVYTHTYALCLVIQYKNNKFATLWFALCGYSSLILPLLVQLLGQHYVGFLDSNCGSLV